MGMTREELEAAVGGEPGGGGMNLWSSEMEEDAELAALEEEIATFDLDAEYDPETGCYMTAAGVPIHGNTGAKIIFRRLPPKISEQEFLEITGLNPSEYNYFSLKNPSRYDSFDPEDRSVAFVNFVDPETADHYLERFDGFLFIDRFGIDYYSTTTRAPNQAIPRIISKIDPLEGTVEETEDFVDFARRYETGNSVFGVYPEYVDGLEMCDLYLQELEEKRKNPPKNESSPLVEYFKELRKEERATGRRLIDRKALPRIRTARKSCIPSHIQRELEDYKNYNAKINARKLASKKGMVPEGQIEITYEECFPQLSKEPDHLNLGNFNEAMNKWSSFSWKETEIGNGDDNNSHDPTCFRKHRQAHPKRKESFPHSRRHEYPIPNPNPSSCQEFVEPAEDYFDAFQDKRKEDRKERRDRERKEKRLKRKSKYEEETGKTLNSVSEVPENEEGDVSSKVETDISPKKEASTPKESMSHAASSNSVKDSKPIKKYPEDEAPFPKRGSNFPNKASDSKGKVGPTKYGPNSYSKDSPRRPYYDRKPQNEKGDETSNNSSNNRSDEKNWRKSSTPRNQRSGWDRDNRDRWERDSWSKDKEGSSNNSRSKRTDDSNSSANTSNKENEKSGDVDSSAKTETAPEIKILQKQKVVDTDQPKADTVKREKANSDKVEEPDCPTATDKSQPKKTIVKKIIRVRKVVPRNDQPVEEGKRNWPADSGKPRGKDGPPPPGTSTSSRQGERDRVKKPGPDSQKPSSSSTSVRPNETTTKDSKPSGSAVDKDDKDKRVRRARPDIQIYRPGSWRQSTTTRASAKPQTAGNGNGNDGSSSASKE